MVELGGVSANPMLLAGALRGSPPRKVSPPLTEMPGAAFAESPTSQEGQSPRERAAEPSLHPGQQALGEGRRLFCCCFPRTEAKAMTPASDQHREALGGALGVTLQRTRQVAGRWGTGREGSTSFPSGARGWRPRRRRRREAVPTRCKCGCHPPCPGPTAGPRGSRGGQKGPPLYREQ